jgi:hypothetical protein
MVGTAAVTQQKRKVSNPPPSSDRSKRVNASATDSGVTSDTFAAQYAPVAWADKCIRRIPWLAPDEITNRLPQRLVLMCRKSLASILTLSHYLGYLLIIF